MNQVKFYLTGIKEYVFKKIMAIWIFGKLDRRALFFHLVEACKYIITNAWQSL